MTAVPQQPQQVRRHPNVVYPGEAATEGVTVFLSGRPGTRKTTWAGLWPSPVFLSMAREGGEQPLAYLPQLYRKPTPPVFRVTSTAEMVQYGQAIQRDHKRYGWKTIVIDTVSTYIDMFISELLQARRDGFRVQGKSKEALEVMMTSRDWGYLENHLVKELATLFHGTGLNVIWIAHIKENWERTENSQYLKSVEPAIAGQTARKLPAICQLMLYADVKLVPGQQGQMVPIHIMHTAPTPKMKGLRHRFAGAFPEGYLVDERGQPTISFESVASRIGQFIYGYPDQPTQGAPGGAVAPR